MTASIQRKDVWAYAGLALPVAIAGLPLYLHAPDYYVTEQGLSLGLIGALLLGVRFFDALQDPLIGWVSDRYARYRKQMMGMSLFALGLGLVALFNPPSGAGLFWLAGCLMLSATAYSTISINLNTLGGLWSDNRFERTRIVAARESFTVVGVLLGVLVPALFSYLWGPSFGFSIFSLAIPVSLFVAWFGFRRWLDAHAESLHSVSNSASLKTVVGELIEDKRICRLMWVTQVGAFAAAFPAVLFLFFVRDHLGLADWSGLYLLLYFGAAMAGFAFWKHFSKDRGKVRSWLFSMWGALLVFTGAIFLDEGSWLLYGMICLGSGFFLGGDLVFPASLLADYVGKAGTGRHRASMAFAGLSFISKFALGLAAGIAFPLLGWAGFTSGEVNSDRALRVLLMLYALIPLCLKALAIFMTTRWRANLESENLYEKNNDGKVTGNRSNHINLKRMQSIYEN